MAKRTKHGAAAPEPRPQYSYTLSTDKPWLYRLLNLETREVWAFDIRDGKMVPVIEVPCAQPLLLPVRAEGPDGTLGDGAIEIWPGHPEHERRKAELEQRERVLAKPRRAGRKKEGK